MCRRACAPSAKPNHTTFLKCVVFCLPSIPPDKFYKSASAHFLSCYSFLGFHYLYKGLRVFVPHRNNQSSAYIKLFNITLWYIRSSRCSQYGVKRRLFRPAKGSIPDIYHHIGASKRIKRLSCSGCEA